MIALLKSLITIFIYHICVYGGVINPDNANPIQMERTNDSATSSYTFYLSLSTRLPANTGVIRITFPISTFDDPSRNPALSLSDFGQFTFIKTRFNQVTLFQRNLFQTTDGTLTSNYLSARWNDIGRYLEIYNISDAINAGSVQITIKFIRNPVGCANRASGNFQIQTFIDSTKVDENLSFGKVIYSDPYILSNQNTISNDGSNLGGFITNYKITFSTTVTLPALTWFRMRFPSAYTFGTTSCALVDTSQLLTCDNNGDNVLIFSGITSELAPNTYTLQIKNIINPTATGFFNQFVLECLFPGTSNVLQLFYNSMNGITINPGQIKSISISGNPLNMNLRIDYTILFTPTNTIPNPGKIEIYFPELSATSTDPNIRKFGLDSTCRVISGLTPIAGQENVSCVTSLSVLTISNFQTFYSQEIQVKIYAVNPGRAAQYSPFIIKTYLYDSSVLQYYVIDENDQAGSISISEVNSLNFVQIDFFSIMTNGTFSTQIPLDFRLYPNPQNELPLSTSTTQHEISIQIPLLWRNKNADWTNYFQQGDKPGVLFGNDPAFDDIAASRPKYSLHVYQFKTPKATNYAKFPPNYGLAQCDLPISIDRVIMPPFGGKYVFRVLTFLAGTHYVDVPLEQDLYQMDIPIPNFTTASVTTTGSQSGDVDNVIIATLVTALNIPYEGAINFNMTTTTVFSENTSKWDSQLGQTMAVSQTSVNVPCSIFINGDLSGFSNSNHPNARCYVFKGSQIQNVILQVRGFSTNIGGGSTIQIYVPNIRLCEDVLKQCYVTINSSYTADLTDPYILNTIYVKVVNSINNPSPITPAANTALQAAPTFANPVGQSKEICLYATWDLGSTFYSTPFKAGDYIIIIFPSYRYTYRKAAVQSITYTLGASSGTVVYIDFYTTKETYYLIRINTNVAVGSNLYLYNVKNANDIIDFGPNNNISINQGVVLKGKFWQSGLKITYLQWAISPQYKDGGILFTNISILPNIVPAPVRTVATDMEWEAEIVYKIDFTNCREVPEGGQFNIQIPNGTPYFKAINSQCNIQQGLTGISQLTIQSSISCQIVNNAGFNYIQISQFKKVAQETSISVIFRATNPAIQGSTWNPGNYYITSNDETASHTVINFTSNTYLLAALNVAGPSIFPTTALWQSFYITDRLARQGERGYFKMEFTSPISFAKGSTMQVNFGGGVSQPTNVDLTIYHMNFQTMKGYLYCTINGDIAEDCTIAGQTVTLLLPKSNSIDGVIANVQYTLVIGYRGNDDSSTTRDGFLINQADTYILSASITDGSNTVQTQKAYRNLAPSFTEFVVWSINKLVTDTTDTKCFGGGTNICGRTVFIFRFSNNNNIPAHLITSVSQTLIILEFSTYISSDFPNGFSPSLGTGLPQRSEVPCEGKNIPVMTGYDRISCKLYLGTSPNPTQIIIRYFNTMIPGTYEIHIPDVFNPTQAKDLLQVNMRVETTSLTTGTTTPIYENSYILVNMTNTIQSHTFHQKPLFYDLTATCTPTFQSTTNIDTLDWIQVCFHSGQHDLQGGDHILFQFPSMWIMPDVAACTLNPADYGAYANCDSYDSNKQVLIKIFQAGPIAKNTMYTGQIQMKTPPYRALVPAAQQIFGYTYWRSRLMAKFQIKDFTQSLVELTIPATDITITTSSNVQGEVAEYTISYVVIRDIPNGGCIQIIIPLDFKGLQKESICRNALLKGSDFDPYGYQFKCDLVTNASPAVNDYLLVHDFGPFKLDFYTPALQQRNGTTLVVNFRVQNPTVASPAQWTVKQWYKNELPLNLLVAVGNKNSPNLIAATTISYWEKLQMTRNKLYTTDIGPLEFRVQVPSNLNAGSTITVQLPASFTIQTDAQLFCYWDLSIYYNNKYPARTCTINGSNLVTIETPIQAYLDLFNPAVGQPIAASSYIVIGISTIDHYTGTNGVVMPSTSGFYQFTITFPGAVPSVATRKIYLPLKNTFFHFEPTTLINNAKERTVIDIYVRPKFTCDNFILYVPVVDQEGNDLFDEDLGTGKSAQVGGVPINCQYTNGSVQTALTCKLNFGDKPTLTHATITISGITFSAGTSYVISIDEIVNPNVTVDDRHVYMILEGYSGASLVSSQINYDFSFKYVNTPAATDVTVGAPYPLVNMGGTGAGPNENNINYVFTIIQKQIDAESAPEKYDYFIIEFPSYAFNKQPLNVDCNIGTCRLLQGWNWVIWKYNADVTVGNSFALQVQKLENVKISSSTVQLTGYYVKNRVVVDKRYFTALNPVTPIAPSAGDFTITAPDYTDVTKIPKNQMTRYIFTLKLPVALQKNQGVVDFIFPANYIPEPYCSDTLAYPFPAAVDFISCVLSSASTVSISNYDNVAVGQIIQIEAWATNPSTAKTAPPFKVEIYQDASRTMKLTSFTTAGPDISNYDSTYFVKSQADYTNSIREDTYGEFNFFLQPGMALSETDYIYLKFPDNNVDASTTYLTCGFDNIESALCKVTQASPLVIRIYGPVDTPLTSSQLYKVYVTIENGVQQGLHFQSPPKETFFQVTNSNNLGTLTDVYFTIYPAINFSLLAKLETTFENSGKVIDLIVTVQTTNAVPSNGKIVVAFPKYAEDGTTLLFNDFLGKTGLVPGSTVDCTSKYGITVAQKCIIESNFRKVMVSQRLSGGLNGAISLLINDITLPTQSAATGQISIEVYTTNPDGTLIEASIFRNILTPFTPSADPPITPATINFASPARFDFNSISVGAAANSFSGINDRIVFKLPIGYDLNSATFVEGSPYAATEYFGIGNIMIVRLRDTINSGSYNLILENVGLPAKPQTTPKMNVYVVVGHVYNTWYQGSPTPYTPSPFTTPSLTLPYYTSNGAPTVIQITFTAPTNLIGSNTIYFATLNSVSVPPPIQRIGASLQCSAGGDPLYCQLVTSGTYYGQTISSPTIIITGMLDALTSTPRTIIIYNIKEYVGGTTISIDFQAIDIVNTYIKYKSTITVSQTTDAITTVAAQAVTITSSTLQDLDNLVFTITQNLVKYTVGTKILLLFDNFPSQTLLNKDSLTPSILFDGANSQSCTSTFDTISLAVICPVTTVASTSITLNMLSILLPTIEFTVANTVAYQLISYTAAKVVFQYHSFYCSTQNTASTFNSVSAKKQSPNMIELKFQSNLQVPATCYLQVTLGSSPATLMNFQAPTNSFSGQYSAVLSGSTIKVQGFSFMGAASYVLQFSFQDSTQVPSITNIATMCNGFNIETKTVSQTNSVSTSINSISINKLAIIEYQTILLQFTTSTTFSNGYILLEFSSNISGTFSAQMIDYSKLSLMPTFTVSTKYIYIQNIGTYNAGQVTMKLFFTTLPTQLTDIYTISQYYEVVDQVGSSNTITPRTFMTARNSLSLGSLQYISNVSVGGSNVLLTFRLKLKAFSDTSDQLMFTFPTDIDIDTMYTNKIRLKCNIKRPFQAYNRDRSRKCYFQKLTKTYLIFQEYNLIAGEVYDIEIIRIGDSSSNRYFWTLPSSPKVYYFTLDKTNKKAIQDTSAPIITHTDSIQMEVYASKASSSKFQNYEASVNKPTLMNVQFNSGGSFGFIDIEFPITQDQGGTTVNLFDQKLGSTLLNGQSFTCKDKGANLGVNVKYRLLYGQSIIQNSSRIRILYASSGNININIQNLLNPSTVNKQVSITVKSGSTSGVLSSMQVFRYAVYTLSHAPATAALPAPSFLPATASTLVQITMSNLALTSNLIVDDSSILKFEFDPRQYNTGTVSANSNSDFLTSQAIYFSITSTTPLPNPYNLVVTSILTPPIIGTFTYSSYIVTEIRNRKVRKVFTLAISQPLSAGGSFAINQAIVASTYNKAKTSVRYSVTYDLQQNQIIGNVILVKFPSAQYTIPASLTCSLLDKTSLSKIQSTCASDTTKNGFVIQLTQALNQGTSYKINMIVDNPASAGLTGSFTLEFYKDNTFAELQSTLTIAGINIVNQLDLVMRMLQPYSTQRVCQSGDTCPLRFSITLAAGLTKETDYFKISTSYIGVTIQLQAVTKELACWINDYAAYNCYIKAGDIYIYAPVQTTIASGTTVHVHVRSWRDQKWQLLSNPIQDFILLPTWTYYLSFPANLKNVPILQVATPVKKDWIFVNKAFNWNNFGYFCSCSTTINHHTILRVRFQMPTTVGLNDALPTTANWGKFVIYLETYNEVNQQLIPFTLDNRFIKDGQEIDCICTNCGGGLKFLCYVQYGGTDKSSPVSITIQPQQYTWPSTTFLFSFPKIKLPSTANYYVRISMKAIQFNSGTSSVDELLELLGDYIFYTNPDSVTTASSAALSFPGGHRVGDPMTVNWNYNIPQTQALLSRDRVIITTTTLENLIEQPTNPAVAITTTSNVGTVRIYPLVKWLEIEFTTNLGANAKTAITYNFKNMPFQITPGVDYELYTYAGGEQRNIQPYNNIAFANPHPLNYKNFAFTVQYISQPNTITFKYQPYNKIPIGGYISIYWGSLNPAADADWLFLNNYCRIISGLQDAQCNIVSSERRIYIYDWSKQYDPVIDGIIKFDMQVQNSGTAGMRTAFTLTTFWDLTGYNNRQEVVGSDSTKRHIIDQDLAYTNFNVLTLVLLKLNLLERYQEPIEVCGGTRGPIVLKFKFRKNYSYPSDYIEINFFSQIQQLVAGEELICYFADNGNPTLIFVKTFRCDLRPNGVIWAFVPEETDLLNNTEYLLVLTVRTANVYTWGIQVNGPSAIKFTRISTSNENQAADYYQEVAWIEAHIPPCSFDPNVFRIYSYSHEANSLTTPYNNQVDAATYAEQYLYTYVNITLATINNNIATGQIGNAARTRIIFQFQTHNEIFPSWDEDPTGTKSNTAGPASCGGLYNTIFGTPLIPANNQPFLQCTVLPASGQLPSTPAYIMMEGHPAIAANNAFSIALGRIKLPNKLVDGTVFTQIGSKKYDDSLAKRYQTSAHMKVFIQQLQPDGTFYPINSQWRYYLIPQFIDPSPPAIMSTTQFYIHHYYSIVNYELRNVTVSIFPLGFSLNKYQSAVVLQYGYPYNMVNNAKCVQHDLWDAKWKCTNTITCDIPHGPVACTFLPQSRWLVFSNNLDTVTNQFMARELENTGYANNRLNPPFTYEFQNAKSPLRAWVYDNFQTVIMRTDEMITPKEMTCGMVMETTAADNPQNRDVLYRVGLYMFTRASEMKTIRLLAPKEFQNIRNCKIKKGVVLIDFNDISNEIKCTIVFQNSNWLIEITNFYYNDQYVDGLIIFEFLITNPYDSGWTKDWSCRTFSANENQIHDFTTAANGKTWVGKYIPFPNLFRVYRNQLSFQDRRAGISQYAEMNMRIIPRKYHPQTDDSQSTQIQIWMPLTYDIPNGGTNVCNVDHIYHTDIDGQYCQITSDRKIFVNTNRYVGLFDTCGLVSFTTVNAINNQNGVKMPAVAGDDQFQVFITSKDATGKVTQEYSDLGATTNPSYLSISAYPSGNSYLITTNVHQSYLEARIIVQFYTPRNIPPGYDTSVGISDPSLKNPIGYIDVMFNTIDHIEWWGQQGWALNLLAASPKNPFACKAYSGLVPKSGEKLICTIIPSPLMSVYNPVIVRVSNFQSIAANQFIELHLLNIPSPPYTAYQNDGYIDVKAFQVNGDGSQNDIIGVSRFTLGGPAIFIIWNFWTSNRATVSPNQVGAYSEWIFSFDMMYDNTNTYQGCFDGFGNPLFSFPINTILIIKMPNTKFILVDDGKIQATFANIPVTLWVYEDTNQIFIKVPANIPCGTSWNLNVLKISQLRNAAFRFPTPYSIQIDSYDPSAKTVIRSYLFTPISNPAAGDFVSLSMYLSKYFADERYVTYTYTFTPSYKVPAGSLINIILPNRAGLSFPNFGSASPKETCQVSDTTLLSVSSCSSTLTPTGFSILALQDIAEQTSLTVSIIGTRNHPSYAQITQATDFQITILHPLGYEINNGYFPLITYLQKRDASFLYLTMTGSSYFQNIITDYQFVIQSTSELPIGGYIVMKFPVNYLERALTLLPLPKPSSITGSWTANQLTYTSSWSGPSGGYYTLTITPQFIWPAKSSMNVQFNSFPNPMTTTTTNLFQVYTIYDGKNVDSTDPTDTSLYFSYEAQPASMSATFDFSPKNEASLSTYKITLTPSQDIPVGSSIQFKFDTSLYPSTLSSAKTTVSCLVNGVQSDCTVENGVVSIPVTEIQNANTPISIQLNNIMNPSQGSTKIVGQVSYANKIIQYKPDIGPVQATQTPQNLQLVLLQSSSNALQARARYTFCVETANTISITDQVFIFFPPQFPFKSTYTCSITSDHSNNELNYAQTATSPLCTTSNDENKIIISGQTAAKTSSNLAKLCYQIDGVENPSIPGTTDNFTIQIFDSTNKVIKSETSGLTSTQTTLSFVRKGFQIIVSTIPDLAKGSSSNDISIELEIAVSYVVTAIPYLLNFEFIPPLIVFDPTKGKVQTFKIKPLDAAVAGAKIIVWTKQESTSTNKFSDIPDTSFNLIEKPYANSLKAVLQTTVSRTALLATSLPIEIKLNQPASKVLTISMYTKNHQQDSLLVFDPSPITFKPGEVSKTFSYTTKNGAVSGQIEFELDSYYKNIYVMPYTSLSFEILDIDNNPPNVINYYIESMDRTYMYLRISCDESITVYSMLTLQGTELPTTLELKNTLLRSNNGRKTDVLELFMKNSSYVAPVTTNYIYYDSYLLFTGLEEQTEYLLYFYVEDLSGNASPVQNFSFKTLKKHNPCAFSLRVTDTIEDDVLFSAFGLITTLPSSRFKITNKPSKYSIPGVIEQEIQDIIDTVPMDYEFILLQNKTSDEVRPLQTISLLDDQFSLLQTELSSGRSKNMLDSTYKVIEHAYELNVIPQEFKYNPVIGKVTEDSVSFMVSLKYKGIGYGIVQLAEKSVPTSRQIKYGLNSTNFYVPLTQYQKIEFVFKSGTPEDQQNITNTFAFSELLDNSEYIAYFIGENNQLVNPDLMENDEILQVRFTTSRESITIPSWFRADIVSAQILGIQNLVLLLTLMIISHILI